MLSSAALKQAAAIQEQIEALEAQRNQLLTGGGGAAIPTGVENSVAGSMSASAPVVGATGGVNGAQNSTATGGNRPKRYISPAGRKRIAAAQKKRWAAAKSGANAQTAAK